MILLVSLLWGTKTRKQISNSTRPTFEQFRLLTIHHTHRAPLPTLSPGGCHCRNSNLRCASEQHLHTETRGWLTIIFLLLFKSTVKQLREASQEWTWGKDSPLTGLQRADGSKNQTGVCRTPTHTFPNTPLHTQPLHVLKRKHCQTFAFSPLRFLLCR